MPSKFLTHADDSRLVALERDVDRLQKRRKTTTTTGDFLLKSGGTMTGPISNLRTDDTSIALGSDAGATNQGANCVAVGYRAGYTNQHTESIVINADNAALESTSSNQIRLKAGTTTLDADAANISYNGDVFLSNAGELIAPTDFVCEKPIGECYFEDNTTATASVLNNWVKIAGTTIANADNHKFTHTNNRLTYTGTRPRIFHCGATISVTSPSNSDYEWSLGISKNGVHVTGSKTRMHTVTLGDHYSTAIHSFVTLETNDYIEVEIMNNTGSINVEVEDLNLFAISFPNTASVPA